MPLPWIECCSLFRAACEMCQMDEMSPAAATAGHVRVARAADNLIPNCRGGAPLVGKSNLGVEIPWRRTGLERCWREREVACGAAPDGGRVRDGSRVGGRGGENGGPHLKMKSARRARRGGQKGWLSRHGVGDVRRFRGCGGGVERVCQIAKTIDVPTVLIRVGLAGLG